MWIHHVRDYFSIFVRANTSGAEQCDKFDKAYCLLSVAMMSSGIGKIAAPSCAEVNCLSPAQTVHAIVGHFSLVVFQLPYVRTTALQGSSRSFHCQPNEANFHRLNHYISAFCPLWRSTEAYFLTYLVHVCSRLFTTKRALHSCSILLNSVTTHMLSSFSSLNMTSLLLRDALYFFSVASINLLFSFFASSI